MTKLGPPAPKGDGAKANRRSSAGGTGPPAKRLRRMSHPERGGRARRRAAGERSTGRSRQSLLAALDVMIVDAETGV
jgi:hypothetical protein